MSAIHLPKGQWNSIGKTCQLNVFCTLNNIFMWCIAMHEVFYPSLILVCIGLSGSCMLPCGSHEKWICAQCLVSVFTNLHIPEKHNTCPTPRCANNRPPVNASVCWRLFACASTFVYAWGRDGWTEMFTMLVYLFAFVLMLLRMFPSARSLFECYSPGCKYSLLHLFIIMSITLIAKANLSAFVTY